MTSLARELKRAHAAAASGQVRELRRALDAVQAMAGEVVHAQFETIHPYTDGNGRVGRALIHTVLTRRGLTPSAVLPLSLVLLTRSDAYLDGLTAYRHDGAASSADAQSGLETWLWTFLGATELAVDQVVRRRGLFQRCHNGDPLRKRVPGQERDQRSPTRNSRNEHTR